MVTQTQLQRIGTGLFSLLCVLNSAIAAPPVVRNTASHLVEGGVNVKLASHALRT